MRDHIVFRWMGASHMSKSNLNEELSKYWAPSTLKKFWGISSENPTAQGILEQFNDDEWRTYKTYNPQFANWEYLVLLKLVALKSLKCRTSIINGRDTLVFKYPKSEFNQVMEQLEIQYET